MNFLPLLFPPYFRRLRWEIAGWWIFSAVLSLRALAGVESEKLAESARAEVMVAVWMVLRLALIDDVFGTLAGRHWRPVRGWQIAVTRLLLSILVLLPPLLLRVYVWDRMGHPDAAAWHTYLGLLVRPLVLNFVVLGLGLQLAARVKGWLFKRAFRVGSAVFLVLAAWFSLRASGRIMMQASQASYPQGPQTFLGFTDEDEKNEASTTEIIARLPKDALVFGHWNIHSDNITASAGVRELQRLPLRPGSSIPLDAGTVAEISDTGSTADRLSVEIRFRCRDAKRAVELASAKSVLRFPTGYYAETSSGGRGFDRHPVLLLPFVQTTLRLDISTPAVLPWYRGAEAGYPELILYVRDEKSPSAVEPDPCIRHFKKGEQLVLPALHVNIQTMSNVHGTFETYLVIPDDRGAKLEDQVRAALLMIGHDKPDPRIAELILSKGHAALPSVLSYPAWSDPAWKNLVKPLLLQHATADDRPALLARLSDDPRLVEVFRAKGWQADTLPVLKERLAAGLTVGKEGFGLLLETRDPALAADLTRAATRSADSMAGFEEALRNFPGFDWKGFVHEGWQLAKYRATRDIAGKRDLAVLAAREGDASAFRYIAEQAVLREDGFEEELRKLVTGEPQDAVTRVKENFAQVRFDAANGKWAVP